MIRARQWQHDADVDACGACHMVFTFFRRRHHCRACGRVLCDACTRTRLVFADTGGRGINARPQRVCQACVFASRVPQAAPATLVVPQVLPAAAAAAVAPTQPAANTVASVPSPMEVAECTAVAADLSSPSAAPTADPDTVALSAARPAVSSSAAPPVAATAAAKTVHRKRTSGPKAGCMNVINISPETPVQDPILCTNGWSLYHRTSTKMPNGKASWVLASPDPTLALLREQEHGRTTRQKPELLRLLPFVDVLTVTGVELCLELRTGRRCCGLICGEIHLLTGSCWNPSDVTGLWFNGVWHVSAAAAVPVVDSVGGAGYIQWSTINPGDRDASSTLIRGNSRRGRPRFGPSFRFKTCDTDSVCRQLHCPQPTQTRTPLRIELCASESRTEITLSNGYMLKRARKSTSLPRWELSRHHGPRNAARAFIDTLVLRGVLFCCGSGGVWWEGHIVVSTGAGLYFGGGKFMFNGAWTLSQEACVPARTGNTIVGLQAVSPRFLQDVRACEENSCRRAELFIKYCTKGRSGAGSHAFGPEFSFRLR